MIHGPQLGTATINEIDYSHTNVDIICRIDGMLLDHYGPEMYSKMTSEFDPEGVAALSNYLGK